MGNLAHQDFVLGEGDFHFGRNRYGTVHEDSDTMHGHIGKQGRHPYLPVTEQDHFDRQFGFESGFAAAFHTLLSAPKWRRLRAGPLQAE
jgi:hypothetical protein